MTDGALPVGWAETTVAEVVDVLDHRRVPVSAKERAERRGGVPYYGATGPVGTIDTALFNEPLLLLGEDGAPFFDPGKPKAYTVDGPSWVNNHAHVLRTNDVAVDRRYLKYWFDAFDYRNYANGTTRLKLTKSSLLRIPVWLPPRSEQRRICEMLVSALDQIATLKESLTGLGARLEWFREHLITCAVVGSLGTGDLADEAAAELLGARLPEASLLPEAGLPELPKGWCWVALGDLADVTGGVTKDTKKQHDPTYVEVPYLRVANVQRGHLVLDQVARIRVPADRAATLRLLPGDVLLNEGGDRDKLGRGWVWSGQIPDCIHQNHVFRARIRAGVLRPELLSYYGNTHGRAWFEQAGKQTTNLASISLRALKRLPVPVAPLEEQERILDLVEAELVRLDALRGQIERLAVLAEKLRRAVLRQAFAGRLVPQDPNDEPAELLLKRIAEARTAQPTAARRRRRTVPADPVDGTTGIEETA